MEPLGLSDCERIADAFLAQPANTLSSLAFVAVGVWLFVRARVLGMLEGRERLLVSISAITIVAVGLGSVAYHGPMPGWASSLHDLSIVAFALSVVAVEANRRFAGRTRGPGGPAVRGASRRGPLLIAGGALALAAVLNFAGRTGAPLCDPVGAVQLHALWHVLAAFAMGVWGATLLPARTHRLRARVADL